MDSTVSVSIVVRPNSGEKMTPVSLVQSLNILLMSAVTEVKKLYRSSVSSAAQPENIFAIFFTFCVLKFFRIFSTTVCEDQIIPLDEIVDIIVLANKGEFIRKPFFNLLSVFREKVLSFT